MHVNMRVHVHSEYQGRIQEFRKGGSKIKLMKGEGTGGGAPPPMAGSVAEPQPLF